MTYNNINRQPKCTPLKKPEKKTQPQKAPIPVAPTQPIYLGMLYLEHNIYLYMNCCLVVTNLFNIFTVLRGSSIPSSMCCLYFVEMSACQVEHKWSYLYPCLSTNLQVSIIVLREEVHLKEFQEHFVLVLADKAKNNVLVVYKQ